MPTVKHKVLIGIAKHKRVNNPTELVLETETDMHNLVHILYSMSRQGLVSFRETKNGGMQIPTAITLTKQGKKEARRIQK